MLFSPCALPTRRNQPAAASTASVFHVTCLGLRHEADAQSRRTATGRAGDRGAGSNCTAAAGEQATQPPHVTPHYVSVSASTYAYNKNKALRGLAGFTLGANTMSSPGGQRRLKPGDAEAVHNALVRLGACPCMLVHAWVGRTQSCVLFFTGVCLLTVSCSR
jgi:hypothetical protein